jgi:HEAT repeat protein
MAAIKKANKTKNNRSGQVSVSEEIEKLIKKLNSEITSVRKKAMLSLASAGEPGILALIEVLEDDVNYMDIHPEIIETLGSVGEPAVQLIINSLDSESDANIQLDSIRALVAIGKPAVGPLIEMLNNGKAVERSNAARALGLMGEKSAVKPLISILLSDPEDGPRSCAAEALGEIGIADAADALIKGLNDSNIAVRRKSAKTLGRIKDEKAVEPLIKVLKDSNYKVRADAATALKEIGDERAVAPLIEVLDAWGGGWYWSVDHFIKGALQSFKSKRTAELLIDAFKSDNIGIKEPASEVLAKMGNIALKPLIKALEDEDLETRYYAAKSLGVKKDKRAIKALRCVAENENEDWDVRRAAQSALAAI